jgi:hypothetical protein
MVGLGTDGATFWKGCHISIVLKTVRLEGKVVCRELRQTTMGMKRIGPIPEIFPVRIFRRAGSNG